VRITFFGSATLILLVAGSPAAPAATVVDVPFACDSSGFPGSGQAVEIDFESLPVAQAISNVYAAYGVVFSASASVVAMPSAFGTVGIGSRVAAVGYDSGQAATVTLTFFEPQSLLAAWWVDVEQALDLELRRAGFPVGFVTLPLAIEGVAGGAFMAVVESDLTLWFDEVVVTAVALDDGFGIDGLCFGAPGTVDNDGDGYSELDGDCDDDDAGISPGMIDGEDGVCDGIDSDCDGVADDGDDADGDGVAACAGDCDDTDPAAFPGASEICDGIDNDCNGGIDDAIDLDGDGWDACEGDCDETDDLIFPGAPERCNGLDDDCDDEVDEGCPPGSNPGDDDDDDDDDGVDDDDDDDDGVDDDDSGDDDSGDDDSGDDDDDHGSDHGSDDDDDDDGPGSGPDDDDSDDDASSALTIRGGGCCDLGEGDPAGAAAFLFIAFGLRLRRPRGER
jgi:hypothetical protein